MPLDRLLQGYVLLRADGTSRGRLYDRFYKLHWGNVGTNNYGFAPADAIGPERYQLQMYKELYKLLVAGGHMQGHTDLLEVGCGRGGGLMHFLKLLPGSSAIGLDYSETALRYCREHYRHVRSLAFVRGSAVELPFAEDSFDLLISVEASHNFGGYDGFFREVHRVLRPGGAFLYCDYDIADGVQDIENKMRGAALHGIFHDITSNVAEACRLDSERRRHLIQGCLPWYFRVWVIRYLANYAALEGTRKLEAFRTSRERYYMTCAIKAN
jgi:ubiquinone/menaquinone biosynthesis C-methylase UbiE